VVARFRPYGAFLESADTALHNCAGVTIEKLSHRNRAAPNLQLGIWATQLPLLPEVIYSRACQFEVNTLYRRSVGAQRWRCQTRNGNRLAASM